MDGPAPGAGRARGQGPRAGLTGGRAAALERLVQGAGAILGRPLSGTEADLFVAYLDLLLSWQRIHRLVGSGDPVWMVETLFLDSLLFLRALPVQPRATLDIGAGAGAPGLPLKIVLPEMTLTAVESRRRRASFLATAARTLGLEPVRVLNARAEALVAELAGQFDAVLLRSTGRLEVMLPLATKFARPGGVVLAGGPPGPRPLPIGRWVEVPGIDEGRIRRFVRVEV